MAEWQLRFPAKDIRAWAARYEYEDDTPIRAAGERARKAGKFSLKDFLDVCRWKTHRSASRCRMNTAKDIAHHTGVALTTETESLRIKVLRRLHGVEWPTASVLLHIAHRDPYPILDFRALWSLGFDEKPSYSFKLWIKYVQTCRNLASKHKVDMRTLDRAMWQYSKTHQSPPGRAQAGHARVCRHL